MPAAEWWRGAIAADVMPPHFLWPQSRLARALLQAARFTAISQIEARLAKMFPGGTPVLFSSGRAALTHALRISGLARGDKVGVFPFASHCVLDAVSRIATPAAVGSDARLNVVFQQWGYVQHHDLVAHDVEDCADSLLVPGGQLFPGGGGFEIWSLPKILGTTGGGILWCRHEETAIALRLLRDGHKHASLLWGLRLMGRRLSLAHAFWQGAEASRGCPSAMQTGEILTALDSWDLVVSDRLEKLHMAWFLAPRWLQRTSDRLPCAVPVETAKDVNGDQVAVALGLSAGTRMIEQVDLSGVKRLARVLPIPIHQDVTTARLSAMLNRITHLARNHE